MLRIDGLSISYGRRPALRDVSLTVVPGQVLGLLGPNGAGKTTLMNAVVGAVRPGAGTVTVGGLDVTRHPKRARAQVGYAEQEIAVFPTLTARQNVNDWAAICGVGRRRRAEAVAATLSALLLDEVADRPVRTLSGGERRRVHCAMATVARPSLLLLDEPTVGVDPATRRAVLGHVRDLAAAGTAICYSTHYLPEVEALDADIVLLARGRVATRGAVAELIDRHGSTVVDLRLLGDDGETRTVSRQVIGPDDLPAVLQGLGADLGRLAGVEVRRSTLDEVFDHVVASAGPADGRPSSPAEAVADAS
ncbi:ABC transporter ATP-binding protein [Micromonospora halophytica]|uniref:ABC-2 type transport system ATP-binding protein n=1 Tax=Micromonospora halophytica TaxID=47864 RepID=A0A1C5I6Q7_9ACTN|nr:ABC transporter ATP-binding protein [Micromonospora halophytica]SCG53990.1 ABC-2 type transport system ATP-binding protein [Micromonospora halophytica]